ncbi:MAG: acyl carrier protein [Eggerthellaceae bacterium]|nr:acyl carrier protein [Eggerthellaceae bacterium]
METLDIIRDILNDKLDIEPEKVTMETTFEDLEIDSLDQVELICELEDRLGIDFGEPEDLSTVSDVIAYTATLLK